MFAVVEAEVLTVTSGPLIDAAYSAEIAGGRTSEFGSFAGWRIPPSRGMSPPIRVNRPTRRGQWAYDQEGIVDELVHSRIRSPVAIDGVAARLSSGQSGDMAKADGVSDLIVVDSAEANDMTAAENPAPADEDFYAIEQRLLAVLDTAADAIITINQHGVIYHANPATERMFGYPIPELIGTNVSRLMPSPDREHHDEYLQRYLATGVPRIIGIGRETWACKRDGTLFPVSLSVTKVDDLPLFTGIVRDVTEVRALQQHVLEVASAEQQRIGQELHDGVGQELTGISLLAQALSRQVAQMEANVSPSASPARIHESLVRLCGWISEAQRHVQALSRGILPVAIDPQGLRSALDQLAQSVSQAGDVACRLSCPGNVGIPDTTVATQLYRIAQEALNNALKHAAPTQITLRLFHQPGQVTLEIVDDGRGLPVERIDSLVSSTSTSLAAAGSRVGMGLRTMSYRAGLINGRLQLEPGPGGRGTCVRVSVPVAD